jgi:hypothetical protein
MNRTTISAPASSRAFYSRKSVVPRLLLQIARALAWLIGITLALIVWRAATR